MTMCEDPDLTESLYPIFYMLFSKKLKVGNAKNEPADSDDETCAGRAYLQRLMYGPGDGVIIILHHDSSWDMKELGEDYSLEILRRVKFNKETFQDFSPRSHGEE
ncbi:hypothetical protein CTI12_AA172750 [Artemisia annua]|uniref:Uncharacterized protein n=1 Tax=Artemisia annua TaxID=35608 RepID=A0A2U1PC44_ARTAN|nr:hypothetical protein CTI12_AA172750 [Artemisia annua]